MDMTPLRPLQFGSASPSVVIDLTAETEMEVEGEGDSSSRTSGVVLIDEREYHSAPPPLLLPYLIESSKASKVVDLSSPVLHPGWAALCNDLEPIVID